MKRVLIFGGLLACAALAVPPSARADDRERHERRYYDRDARDYHQWDDHEDRAYRLYLQEQHREYRDFNREKRERQQRYFRWRHEHPNHVLFKVEVR